MASQFFKGQMKGNMMHYGDSQKPFAGAGPSMEVSNAPGKPFQHAGFNSQSRPVDDLASPYGMPASWTGAAEKPVENAFPKKK
jgi:hypothetical protein